MGFFFGQNRIFSLNVNGVGTVAEDGSIIPLFSSVREAAVYNTSLDTTIFTWEGYKDGIKYTRLSTYNHTTNEFGDIIDVKFPNLIYDYHGVPAVLRDHQGYWHVFGGSHAGNLQHSVSDGVDDFTSFTLQTAITGEYGYPKPLLVGSTLYVFARRATTGLNNLALRKTTSLNNGLAVWDTEKTILNLNTNPAVASQRVYAGNFLVVGTEIWFVSCVSDLNDTRRYNVYFFKYDTVTGNVSNYRGTTTILNASLPVNRTQADADFRIISYEETEEGTDIPVFFLDSNNRVHIFYGIGPINGPYNITYIYDNGSTWSTPEIAAQTYGRYDTFAPILLSNGNIELYYSKPWATNWATTSQPLDGEPLFKTRISGVWSNPIQLLNGDLYSIGRYVPILNYHDNAKVIFTELANGTTDAYAGGKHLFIHGNSGFLSRSVIPSNVSAPTVFGTISTGELLVSYPGEWNGYPSPNFSYKWLADGQIIPNQINSTLVVTEDNATADITVRVTASNKYGLDSEDSIGLSTDLWFRLMNNPGATIYSGVPRYVYDGNSFIYAGANDLSSEFWRYNILLNTWTRLADSPSYFVNYGALVYTGNYIYAMRGENYLTMWRYNISSNEWETRSDAAYTMRQECSMVWDGNDYIYVKQGTNKTLFRYSISNDIWDHYSVLTQAILNMYNGNIILVSDNIYVLNGFNTKGFQVYNITSNTWTQKTDTPDNTFNGTSLSWDGDDYIYALQGNNTKNFWRYSISNNSWEVLDDFPLFVRYGGSMISANGALYARPGNGNISFWKFKLV